MKSQLRRYTQLGNLNQQGSSQVYKCGGLMINDENKEVTVDGEPIKLTPIEYNILLLLVKNAGKVFSIDQIYEKIWNEDAIGADNTVAVHIRHIRGLDWIKTETFEQSPDFSKKVQADITNIFDYVQYQDIFEVNGEVDYSQVVLEVTTGPGGEKSYTLDDIIQYG